MALLFDVRTRDQKIMFPNFEPEEILLINIGSFYKQEQSQLCSRKPPRI
jgi:hypothetical protein